MAFERILVPTDFSDCAGVAAEEAARMSQRWGCEVRLLHVDTSASLAPPDSEDAWRVYQEERRQSLRDKLERTSAALAEGRAVNLTTSLTHGGAVSGVVAAARDWNAGLIVIGSRGHASDRFLIGSVAIGVAREAACPVLVVRSDMRDKLPADGQFHRPLAAIDFSRFSDEVARVAGMIADRAATVDLVHVWQSAMAGQHDISPGLEHPDFSASQERIVAREKERLKRFAEREHVAHAEVDARVEVGNVAEVLVSRAEEAHNDVIVVGAHGRDEQRSLFVGSVADRMLRHSPVPVLLLSDASVDALHASE